MQIASMVIEEGGEARTINLCRRCCNEKTVQQGKQSLKSKEWKEVLVKKAHRGRLWKVFGSEQFLQGMWGAWARKILAHAAHEKQEGMQGQWQHESFKEVLEQAKKGSADTDCGPQTMRRACTAMKLGHWESFISGPLREFVKLMRKWQWMISAAWALHRKS